MNYGQQHYGNGGQGYGGPMHQQGYGQGMPYGANERGHGWGQGGGGYMGQGGGYEGVQAQRGGHGGQYGELLYSAEFAEAVERVCREKMNGVLAQQGYFPGGGGGQGGWMPGMQGGQGDDPLQARYEEVLDEIRDAPSGEQHKLVEARFEGLVPEERKMLIASEAPECSIKKKAAKAGLPVERFLELRHGLKYKLKQR